MLYPFQVSTVLHEFCHAIGMHHEQSRSDRDKHVIVHYDNIEAKNKYNLNKENTLDNNPYDYTSIMQYALQVGIYSYTVQVCRINTTCF